MTIKMKWLVALVAVLMVANIALVAFIWLREDPPLKPERPRDARDYLVKSLEMNKEQEKRFDSLRKGHFERIRIYQDSIRIYRDSLIIYMAAHPNGPVPSARNDLFNLMANRETETFNHFSQLRSILNPAQQKLFDSIIAGVLRMAAPQGGMPERPPHHQGDGPPPDGPPPMR